MNYPISGIVLSSLGTYDFTDYSQLLSKITEVDEKLDEQMEAVDETIKELNITIEKNKKESDTKNSEFSSKLTYTFDKLSEFDSCSKNLQYGNINGVGVESGGYGKEVGEVPEKFDSATLTRCVTPIPVQSGDIIYLIFEGTDAKFTTIRALDFEGKIVDIVSSLYAKNKTSSTSLQTEYKIPEGCTHIVYYINTAGSLDYRIGIYYKYYNATTVEDYSQPSRYIDVDKIQRGNRPIRVAEETSVDEVKSEVSELESKLSEFDSCSKKLQYGNINGVGVESGGYGKEVGEVPEKFDSATLTRCVSPIPVQSGDIIYLIFEGIETKYATIRALDFEGRIVDVVSALYAKNKTSSTSLQTEYEIPEGCTHIVYYLNTAGSLDYRIGIYYKYYEATTVEDYSQPSRYIDADKLQRGNRLIRVAEETSVDELKNRLTLDNDINVPIIDSPDMEYSKHIINAVRGELANLWKFVFKDVTVLASGVCGPTLTWKLYSDGLLHISGTGRAYDYCKGLLEDELVGPAYDNLPDMRSKIEAYQAQYEGLTDDDSVAKYERGFQEGKIYDDHHEQYFAPWYIYRPETSFTEYGGDYSSKANYDLHNPNGWVYNRIKIDEGVTYLGNWMLYRICGATELVIPSTVKAIGQWCIRYSPSLKCIYLPDGITKIEKRGCSRHEVCEAIRIGAGWEVIEEYAFAQNPCVKSMQVSGNITSVGRYPFYADAALETVVLDGFKSIDGAWFTGCSCLRRVHLSEGLESIGASAFVNQVTLTTVNIPSTVTSIGQSAFYGCINLKYVYIDSPTIAQASIDASSDAMLGFVIYYAKYIYIKNDIENVGNWILTMFSKNSDINGYTLYLRKE